MMTFSMLSAYGRAGVLLCVLVVLLSEAYAMLCAARLGNRRILAVLNAILTAATFLAAQPMLLLQEGDERALPDYPLIPVLAALAALQALSLAEFFFLRRRSRDTVTNESVKESFDNLPTGLCCYYSGGLLKLVNTRMDALAKALSGLPLQNGAKFWETLQSGGFPGCLSGGEQPMYAIPDGTVFSFRRYALTLEGRAAFELIAYDVTEEYRLTRELEDKQRRAQIINKRLRSLNATTQYLTMNRELLALKVRLHDLLGQSLLYAKRYLLLPSIVAPDELLSVWRLNVKHLKNEAPEDWQMPYFVSAEQAAQLGITLKTTGTLPHKEALLPLVDTALTAHLTNVLRHAGGKTAYVASEESETGYTLTFTNDGAPPEAPIVETGGLLNLRREVEAYGGTMRVASQPKFCMTLFLPKEGKLHGISRFGGG